MIDNKFFQQMTTARSGGCMALRSLRDFCARGGGPGESDAEDAAVGRECAVEAAQRGEEFAAGFEAVGMGVGGGEGFERCDFVDGADSNVAETGHESDLVGADARGFPEADGLGFFALPDESDEVAFEEEHGERIVLMGGNDECRMTNDESNVNK